MNWPDPIRRCSPRRLLFQARQRRRARRGYEPEVTAAIRRTVGAGWTCVDVGAYAGEITRVLRACAGPTGRVVAFEAHPPTAERLAEAMRGEQGAPIAVENLAVTDGERDLVTLYGGRGELESEWNLRGADVEGNATAPVADVGATSLDSYFSENEPVHFVKIDVEGAEGLVLAGMGRLLRTHRPIVLLEVHDDESWRRCERLRDVRYELRDLNNRVLAPGAPRRYHVMAYPA